MLKRLPLLIAVLALAVWLGNSIVKNFLATSLIVYGEDAGSRDQAVAYAPSNPAVVAARGKYWLYRADPPRPAEAISELQRAAALSPRDYRFWLELGRAYENTGEENRAETALRRAVALAPRYFETRWALANLLLRAGKTDDAVIEFRQALVYSGKSIIDRSRKEGIGEFDPVIPVKPDYRAAMSALNAVAGASGAKPDALERVAPSDGESQAFLAEFLASHGEPERALETWRRATASEENFYPDSAIRLMREFQSNGRLAEAKRVWGDIERAAGMNGLSNPESDLLLNEGFERAPLSERFPELAASGAGFDWIIARHPEVRARRTDLEKHGGGYSLYLGFAAAMNSEFGHVSQLVAVEPLQSYRLRYFVKMRNVPAEPNAAPFVEIADAAQPDSFAIRSILPGGDSGWQEQSIGFTVPAETRGLRLRIRNPQLARIDLARITEVWFDDFKLEKAAR
jgi:tetratricopeptide (TPR) repeat protein